MLGPATDASSTAARMAIMGKMTSLWLLGGVFDRVLDILTGLFDRILGIFRGVADLFARPPVESVIDAVLNLLGSRFVTLASGQCQERRRDDEQVMQFHGFVGLWFGLGCRKQFWNL